MDNLNLGFVTAFGIVGTVVTIAAFIYAIVSRRRDNRSKRLAFVVLKNLSIASFFPINEKHHISIMYEQDGQPPINIQGAYLHFIKIGNLGRETIKREDIAPNDPLRLVIANADVLDMTVARVSRKPITFALAPYIEEDSVTKSSFTFDFLDYLDGAQIRILTDNRADISVEGTVIGMPEGVKYERSLKSRIRGTGFGIVLIAAFRFMTWMEQWNSLHMRSMTRYASLTMISTKYDSGTNRLNLPH